jgi:hypothetical protein
MRRGERFLRSVLFGLTLILVPLITGCDHHYGYGYGYVVYDPYYGDYHVWGPDEMYYYNGWAGEHGFRHRDYDRLDRDDQRQYWQWRHNSGHPPAQAPGYAPPHPAPAQPHH